MQKQVGDFSYEVTEDNLRDYVKLAIEERDTIDDHWRKKRFDEDNSKRA